MEEYKLTKEEREMIKKIGQLRMRAKKSIENYEKIPDTLLAHLYDKEFKKLEQAGEIQDNLDKEFRINPKMYKKEVRKALEEDLRLCKRIQYEDVISIIVQDPTNKLKYTNLEKRLRSYVENKLKPYIKEYITVLEGRIRPDGKKIKGAIERARWHEEYAEKLELFKQGKISFNDLPMSEGETRSEELQKQDRENQEQMKKYHKAEDKTGLELPMAEGLKEPTKEVTEEKKTEAEEKPAKKKIIPKSYMPFKKISAETLIALVDNYLMQEGIAEPAMIKKGYAKCTNKDMQSFLQTMDYDTCKKLDIISCSEENSRKLFETIKPRYALSIDMYYGDAVLKDTKTGKSKILDLKLKNFGKS